MKIYINAPEFSDINLKRGQFVNTPEEADYRIYDHSTWDLAENPDKDILLSSVDDEINILEHLNKVHSHHLIGKSSNIATEVERTLSILDQGDHWDPSKGFPSPISSHEVLLSSSKEIKNSIDEVLSNFDFSDQFNEQKDIIRLLANELLVNAFYHQLGEDQDRSSEILLETPVPIQLARNESSVLLRVEDTNGGFPYEKMLASLSRGFRDKTPRQDTEGAGLGLYFVFKMTNQLILNLKENCTEIICMFDLNKRYKEYMKRVSSLHYYTGK